MELEGNLHQLTGIGADELDLAAAAVDLAYGSVVADDEPMPARLKQRILEQAREHLHPHAPFVKPLREPGKPQRGVLDSRHLGWYAAAAILLLSLWAPWSSRPKPVALTQTLAEQRLLLIESAEDLIEVAWIKPEIEEYAQVSGDVVWSSQRQSGFMRLSGLPANRTAVEQYQLWIVDPSRDERPIDGGVFVIPAGAGEVIVPIDAKLEAKSPTVFAITLEQPGGVVVSDGPLIVVAPVGA